MVTHEELRRRLHYNPDTGVWTWLNGPRSGKVAGSVYQDGYRRLSIGGHSHHAARLAFFYMTGRWPVPLADHKDRDPSNDRWNNIREVTRSENGRNSNQHLLGRKPPGHGDGVYYRQDRRKWRARCWNGNKVRVCLGCFDTQAEAMAAVRAFRAKATSMDI